MGDKYEALKLKNQLCFPLYACGKGIVKKYKPILDEFDLTYTQYIVMMVLWEKEEINVRDLGHCLYLDSGTLTPVLKKIEKKGYIVRHRADNDERVVLISLTEDGRKLKEEALKIPKKLGACIRLTEEEASVLYKILYKLLDEFE